LDLLASAPTRVRDALENFVFSIYTPAAACSCCRIRLRQDKLKPAPTAAIAEFHHYAGPADGFASWLLCSYCLNESAKYYQRGASQWQPCRFHSSNSLDPGPVPDELADLSYMELQLIRRVQPYHTLLVLPQGQQGGKLSLVHIPAVPAQSIQRMLPPQRLLFVRQAKPGGSYTNLWRVRLPKVYEALQFLQRHHREYLDVEIDRTDAIQAFYGAMSSMDADGDADYGT
jgi:hypothetical protein